MNTKKTYAPFLPAGIALLSLAFFFSTSYFYVSKLSLSAPGVGLFDDAFMFIRYADNFLGGQEFSWNAGDGAAYGCTSALYLFIVTAGRYIYPANDALLLMGLSFALTLLSLFFLLILAKRVLSNTEFAVSGIYLLLIPAVSLSYAFRFHAFSGMETALALCANSLFLLALYRYGGRQDWMTLALLVITAYLSYLSRPDNGLYLLLTPPLYLWQFVNQPLRKLPVFPALFGAVILFDTLFKNMLFGDILPFGFYAKQRGFYNGFIGAENSAEGLMFFLRDTAGPFLLLAALFIRREDTRKYVFLLTPVILTFAYFLTVVQIMGGIGRYYYPALPFFVFAALLALKEWCSSSHSQSLCSMHFTALRATIIILTIIVITSTGISNAAKSLEVMLTKQPVHYKPSTMYSTAAEYPLPAAHDESVIYYSIEDMISFLNGLPGGITVAATEHGMLSARLPQIQIIDLMGLHDRHIIRNGFSSDYVFIRKPDVIWFPHDNYTLHRKELIDHPAFFRDYEYYPKLYRFGLALRKDSIYFGSMKEKLIAEFARLYPGLSLEDFRARKLD